MNYINNLVDKVNRARHLFSSPLMDNSNYQEAVRILCELKLHLVVHEYNDLQSKVEQLEKELTLNIVEVDFQKHLNSRLVELVETVIGQEEWDQKRQQIQDQLNEILNDKEQGE